MLRSIEGWFMRSTARIVAGTLAGLMLTTLPVAVAQAAPQAAPPPVGPASVSVTSDRDADPVAEGTPRKPSRDAKKTKQQQSKVQADAADELPDFIRDGYEPHEMPAESLPYRDERAPRTDAGLHDSKGVRLFNFGGQNWEHPVAQAQWGLANVTTYLATGDQFYLDRALANAQRNVDRKVVSRGAWWYPYDFDLTRCTGRPLLQAPWYSGMAQGQLLSLFVRLFEITGDEAWKTAADNTFASLTVGPDPTGPWGAWVDPDGYLWMEEYPQSPGITGERVMNGHIFATYGVYDYWRITASADAAKILEGAISTVRRYLPDPIRTLRWASKYSLGCPAPHLKYHGIHTRQMIELYEITHNSLFATNAYLLRSDYPMPTVNGTVQFQSGTHVGYKFDSDGGITSSKSLTLSGVSTAQADQRIRVIGRNYYYRITNGAFAGFLVPEAVGARILLGKVQEQTYNPVLTLAFQPGTYTGYAYDAAGNVTGSKALTFSRASTAPLGASAIVNGRLSYQVTAGAYVGYWLPHVTGLSFS
jgi:hypothetical protein